MKECLMMVIIGLIIAMGYMVAVGWDETLAGQRKQYTLDSLHYATQDSILGYVKSIYRDVMEVGE